VWAFVTDTIPKRVRIAGPDGRRLTFGDLPPPTTKRWVVRRKAAVVAAVSDGTLSIEEACKLYGLTAEELHGWQCAIYRYGYNGLRVTRIQQYQSKGRGDCTRQNERRRFDDVEQEALISGAERNITGWAARAGGKQQR
jgi:Protein of unknown function (DUF1153)